MVKNTMCYNKMPFAIVYNRFRRDILTQKPMFIYQTFIGGSLYTALSVSILDRAILCDCEKLTVLTIAYNAKIRGRFVAEMFPMLFAGREFYNVDKT